MSGWIGLFLANRISRAGSLPEPGFGGDDLWDIEHDWAKTAAEYAKEQAGGTNRIKDIRARLNLPPPPAELPARPGVWTRLLGLNWQLMPDGSYSPPR